MSYDGTKGVLLFKQGKCFKLHKTNMIIHLPDSSDFLNFEKGIIKTRK